MSSLSVPPHFAILMSLNSASLCVSPPSSLSPSLTLSLSLFSNVTNCALVIFIRSCCRCCCCCCHCQRCPCSTLSARLLQLPRPPFFFLPAYRDACYRLHICNAELACACLKWLMTAQLGSALPDCSRAQQQQPPSICFRMLQATLRLREDVRYLLVASCLRH